MLIKNKNNSKSGIEIFRLRKSCSHFNRFLHLSPLTLSTYSLLLLWYLLFFIFLLFLPHVLLIIFFFLSSFYCATDQPYLHLRPTNSSLSPQTTFLTLSIVLLQYIYIYIYIYIYPSPTVTVPKIFFRVFIKSFSSFFWYKIHFAI